MVAWTQMFFETLRFSRICRHQSCVPEFKSWRGGQVNVTLFFLYYSQTSSPNRSYNEFYEICIVLLTATVSRVLAYAWWSTIQPYFGGGGKGVSPDSWRLAWKVTFLPVSGCQLHYDALERIVSLKTAIPTLPVNMWLLHIFLRCGLVFSLD